MSALVSTAKSSTHRWKMPVAAAVFEVEAVERYVLGRRTVEGGYSFYRTPDWGVEEPNAPDTLAALESLRILGLDPPDPGVTGRWLRGLQADDGGYPTLTIGWAALRALNVIGAAPARSPARWLSHAGAALLTRHGLRDWRTALVDTLRWVDAVRLTVAEPALEWHAGVSEVLAAARDSSGGWARPGPELETTAVAVRLTALAGLPREREYATVGFLRRCEDKALGLRLAPDAATTSAGALWGGLELAQEMGIAPRYPSGIRANLALLQRSDGGLGARHHAISTLRDTWLGLKAAQLFEHIQED